MKYYRDDSPDNERMKCVEHLFIYHELDSLVNSVCDHEGTLNVYWNTRPSKEQLERVDFIWEYFSEYEIEHWIETYVKL